MTGHATFPPSDAKTWLHCSFSARNAVPEPPKPSSTKAAADAGTASHAEMEAGRIPEVEAFIAQLEPGEVLREMRVVLTDECWGTADVVAYAGDEPVVTVLDGKFGKWDVPAVENLQLLTYAAAVSLRVARAIEWWRLVIYQPNGLDDEPWKQWVCHRSVIEAHKMRVLAAIADTSGPKPGPHCRWCRAFQACPAMSTDAGFLMGAMSRRIEDLTHADLQRMLRLIRALGDVKPVYEEALLSLQVQGLGDPPNKGRSFRAWNDDQQAAAYLMQQFGPKAVKPVSPAQAEKLGPAGKQYAAVGAHKPEAPMKANY